VEPSLESAETAIVTFLWQGGPKTTSVVAVTPSTLHDFSGSVMQRIEGTDTWYLSREVPKAARFAYRFEVDGPLKPSHEDPQFFRRLSTWLPDPRNSRFFIYQTGDTASVLELSDAPAASWSRANPGVERGTIYEATVPAGALGEEREVWVYRPASYVTTREPYPVLIMTDGRTYLTQLAVNNTLDNLIDAGRIPPLLAVGVRSPERDQDLTCNRSFGIFVAEELLPWVVARENAATHAEAVAISGYSLGGLAAACAALQDPDRIGLVLTQSGSFRRPEPGSEWPRGSGTPDLRK
jgi:enterochelin esterase family protein